MCILYVFSMLGWFELILVVQYLIAVRHRPQADLPLYAARRCCVRREDIYIYISGETEQQKYIRFVSLEKIIFLQKTK